jgi:hypothetical protein
MYRRGISPWALWRKHPVQPGRVITPIDLTEPV